MNRNRYNLDDLKGNRRKFIKIATVSGIGLGLGTGLSEVSGRKKMQLSIA